MTDLPDTWLKVSGKELRYLIDSAEDIRKKIVKKHPEKREQALILSLLAHSFYECTGILIRPDMVIKVSKK